jgi:hypothetical protein
LADLVGAAKALALTPLYAGWEPVARTYQNADPKVKVLVCPVIMPPILPAFVETLEMPGIV